MCIKDIVIAVVIVINIVSNSLVIWSSGNILPQKNDTNTTNTTNTTIPTNITNTTTFYLEMLEEGENIFLKYKNLSNNQHEIKRFDEIDSIKNFYKKAHKGLFFPPIFAFLFVAMLGFAYLVEKQKCDCDCQGGFDSCDCSGMGGGGGEAGLGICGLCLAAVFLFFLVIIYVIDVAIGQKASRLAALFLQMAFAILYIVFGALEAKGDGVRKFVLITLIFGGITLLFNFVAFILIAIDIDNCTYCGERKRDSGEGKDDDCYGPPKTPAVELKVANNNKDNDNNNKNDSENNTSETNKYEQNSGNDNNNNDNENENLVSNQN